MTIKKISFWLIMCAIVAASLWGLDYLAGNISHIQPALSEKNRFVQETSPLITSTNHLLPNLDDRFINEQRTDGMPRVLRTNEYGLVIGKPSTRSPPDYQYILFLGGSTTENNEVDEDYRFPFFAVERLSKDTPVPYIGVNGGVRGHTTQDSINLYLNHPDPKITDSKIVVIMHNINDRLRLRLNDGYKSSITNPSPLSHNGVENSILGTLDSIWLWLSTRSNLLTLLEIAISKHFTTDNGIVVDERIIDTLTPLGETQSLKFKQNYLNLIALAKANNQIPVLMTQPLGKPSVEQDLFNQKIREVAREQNVALIDLAAESKKHPNQSSLFYDDSIHFNNTGSRWASEIIAHELNKLVGRPVRPIARRSACHEIYADGASIVNSPLQKNVLAGRYPSFNQSETKILFQNNGDKGSSINLLDVHTGKVTTVLRDENPEGLEHPTWIDGETIVFTRKHGAQRTLHLLNTKTRSETSVLNQKVTDLHGAIANAQDRNIVYFAGYLSKNDSLSRTSIYRVDPNIGKPFEVINSQEELWRPFVTKSGTVYFIAYSQGLYQIVRSNGMTYEKVVPSDYEQWDPAVSDDNKLIAYAERRNGDFDIWVKDLSRPEISPKRITTTVEDEWDPRFSPSGRYLLYAGTSPFGDQIRALCLK